MSERFGAVSYTNVSTDTTILTTAGYFYGYSIVPATTAACTLLVYDAKATGTGTVVFGQYAASTAGRKGDMFVAPVACRTGIHVDVTCTSGADQIVIYFAKAGI